MRVGFVGWRGMVGSVLMERMLAEGDFADIEPIFFTTSNVGGQGRAIGRDIPALKDAKDIAELKTMDAIISCQGGDYTKAVFPNLRAEGWDGYYKGVKVHQQTFIYFIFYRGCDGTSKSKKGTVNPIF